MKRRSIFMAVVLTLILTFPSALAAAVPGFSDYDATAPVSVSSNAGEALEIVSATTGVAVAISAEVLPAGTTAVSMVVNDVPVADIPSVFAEVFTQILRNEETGVMIVGAIDLSLVNQNQTQITTLDEPVSITVPVPEGVNAVCYIDPVTGQLVITYGQYLNGFLTFDTDYVGPFTLIRKS